MVAGAVVPTPSAESEALQRHAIQYTAWLPACAARLKKRQKSDGKHAGLRYFTFCGNDPDDVVLLQVENLLPAASDSGFESVSFFDRNGRDPMRAASALHGASPFSTEFLPTVLAVETLPVGIEQDSSEGQHHKNLLQKQAMLLQRFPFDVVNFDLEEVLFQDGEMPPGRLLEGLVRMFKWQYEKLKSDDPGFSLMLTVRRPDAESILEDARRLLRDTLQSNLDKFPSLSAAMLETTGAPDVAALEGAQWHRLFELSMPKLVLQALHETGWTIDSASGIRSFHRFRQRDGVTEDLYHIVADVCPREAGDEPHAVQYGALMEQFFRAVPTRVTEASVTAQVRTSFANVQTKLAQNRNGYQSW